MLTIKEVLNAKPRVKGYKLGDGGGLYLYVTPAGGKSWRFKYRYGGVELVTFGRFPGFHKLRHRANGVRDRPAPLDLSVPVEFFLR